MKLSSVMVVPTVPLDMLPPHELEIVSRFLFQTMRGVDAAHTRRWRRMWSRVAAGEVLQVYPVVDRSGAYHRRHMAIEGRIFEAQDGFAPHQRAAFRLWLKTGAGLGTFEREGDRLVFVPSSLSYESLSDDEAREFHENAMAFLHTPAALKRLWPAVKASQRMQMLEAALTNPNEDTHA